MDEGIPADMSDDSLRDPGCKPAYLDLPRAP
jgi:hypothetical protein